jgi:hypothetical protein
MPGLAFTATHCMDLIELKQLSTSDRKEEIVSEGEECVSREILIKELKQMF